MSAEQTLDTSATVAPAAPPRQEEPSSFRLIATMGVAGLVAGVVLVGIYLVTKPLIDQNRYNDLQGAILDILPETGETRIWVLQGDELAPYEGPEGQLPEGEAVYASFDEAGQLLGYSVPAEGPGYQDTIRVLYGFDPVRQVIVGLAVLENKETPGLGDLIVDDPDFHANFEALAIEPGIVAVRDGRVEPNQVDVISGATISSEAIVNMLNASTQQWAQRLVDLSQQEGE